MERHVRSFGFLFYFVGTLLTLVGLISAAFVALGKNSSSVSIVAVVLYVLIMFLGVFYLFVGRGIRTYQPWARIVGVILGALLLPGFPIGTALGAYGLWALLSADGAALFKQ